MGARAALFAVLQVHWQLWLWRALEAAANAASFAMLFFFGRCA
jgi:hypothetical protein